MRVAVVIPWRGGQPDRDRHQRVVLNHLRTLLPGVVALCADSQDQPFSRAASRNYGVRLAEQAGAHVVVVCDADTLVEAEPLQAAITGARDGLLHLPYTHFRGLSRLGTEDYLNGKPAAECTTEMETTWSTGGVMVSTPAAWFAAGGMDETLVGVGFEDTCFRICADAILGPTVKHEGVITHLWHPSEFDLASEQYKRNALISKMYTDAEGDPASVRAVVAKRATAGVPA